MKDWSQSGEQSFILDWAQHLGRNGHWLDIGAADGASASNTRALAEQGWGGVAVEAAAHQFDELLRVYHDRPDVECVQAAVTARRTKDGPLIPFHYSRELVSTTQDENADTWSQVATFTRCTITAVTVRQLLDVFPGPYDLISVDTEGTSLPISEELLIEGALGWHGLLCVECEDGQDRWLAQQWCLDGYARVAVTPNNLLLERL